MGKYRVEVTFELADEDLNDLTLQSVGGHPQLPSGWPQLPPLSDDKVMDLASSALSLSNRDKVLNLVSSRLSVELGTWLDCPVHLTAPGLQVVDLAHPDLPPVPFKGVRG